MDITQEDLKEYSCYVFNDNLRFDLISTAKKKGFYLLQYYNESIYMHELIELAKMYYSNHDLLNEKYRHITDLTANILFNYEWYYDNQEYLSLEQTLNDVRDNVDYWCVQSEKAVHNKISELLALDDTITTPVSL